MFYKCFRMISVEIVGKKRLSFIKQAYLINLFVFIIHLILSKLNVYFLLDCMIQDLKED